MITSDTIGRVPTEDPKLPDPTAANPECVAKCRCMSFCKNHKNECMTLALKNAFPQVLPFSHDCYGAQSSHVTSYHGDSARPRADPGLSVSLLAFGLHSERVPFCVQASSRLRLSRRHQVIHSILFLGTRCVMHTATGCDACWDTCFAHADGGRVRGRESGSPEGVR